MHVQKLERRIYSEICRNDGIRAKDIGKDLTADRAEINHVLYTSPLMKELCWQDDGYLWHGLIRQKRPHDGLFEFSGYYSTVKEFRTLPEEAWLQRLEEGCTNIGRNLNDTRGLIHSFLDTRAAMMRLFDDLQEFCSTDDWEIVFELRIKKSRMLRIYADVLVITENRVFSLEFKMKDEILPGEVLQAVKYAEYIEVIFGPDYEVIPALVLTRTADLYREVPVGQTDGMVPAVSGDMLFNLFDEYMDFLKK